MPMESIVENMSVTHYLGVVVLHHLFENTLRNMANNDETRIDAVNVATHPRTGVSSETVAQVLKELYDKHGYLSSEEITKSPPLLKAAARHMMPVIHLLNPDASSKVQKSRPLNPDAQKGGDGDGDGDISLRLDQSTALAVDDAAYLT
ncbi:unnamed protein product [Heligmosomoides polygyrus]|uniref:LisH domain-containing protein n=1 Tax=Heligmosomoides polygyrus TaxID=6339 RepID=A0A183G6M4_HELPZ|nr:unnamed protein product [Heligmosomoides polygyrus]